VPCNILCTYVALRRKEIGPARAIRYQTACELTPLIAVGAVGSSEYRSPSQSHKLP
jgi:hypothetical protein